MAIAQDTASPFVASVATATPVSVSVSTQGTNRFLVAVAVFADNAVGSPLTVSGGGLTWTRRVSAPITGAYAGFITAEIWTAPAAAQLTSASITMTPSAMTAPLMGLAVYALTGVSGVGASASVPGNESTATALSVAVNAQAAGSFVVAGVSVGTTATLTEATGNTRDLNASSTANVATFHLTALTSAPGNVTVGSSGADTIVSSAAALEILADLATATPTCSPAAGSYTSTQSVTLACTSPSPTIYYTVDGTTPTAGSPVYSGAISVSAYGPTTIKALATSSGLTDSAVATFVFGISPISYVGKGTASNTTAYSLTVTPTVPAAAVTGDLIIVVANSYLNAAISCTANPGSPAFAEVATQLGGTNYRVGCWWRVVQAGESGAVPTPTFSVSGTANKFTAQAFVFRGCDPTTPIDVAGPFVANAAALTWTGATVSIATAGAMVMFAGGSVDDNNWGTWGGGIDSGQFVANAASTLDNSIFLGYEAAAGLQATGTCTAPTAVQTALGSDAGARLTFALRPLPAASGTAGNATWSTRTASSSLGTVTAKGRATVAWSTRTGTSATGTVTAKGCASASWTTQGGTSALGTLSAKGRATATWTAQDATSSLGTLSAKGRATAAWTAQAIVSALGTVSASHSAVSSPGNAMWATQAALAALGTVTAKGKASIAWSTRTATSSAGTVTAKGRATAAWTPRAATSAVGTVTAKGRATATWTAQDLVAALGFILANGGQVAPVNELPGYEKRTWCHAAWRWPVGNKK